MKSCIGAANAAEIVLWMEEMGTPNAPALYPVHINAVFRHIGHAVGRTLVTLGSLAADTEELILCLHQGLVPEIAPVQQLKVEPEAVANSRRLAEKKDKHHGVCGSSRGMGTSSGKWPCLSGQRGHEVPVLQSDKHHPVVLRPSGKAYTGEMVMKDSTASFHAIEIGFICFVTFWSAPWWHRTA